MKPSGEGEREGEKPRAFWVGLVLLVSGCLLLIIFFPQIFAVLIPWYRFGEWTPYVPHAVITVILIFTGLLMMTHKIRKPWVRETPKVRTPGLMVKWMNILWRVVVLSACAVFVVSIFNPFLSARADYGGFWIPEYYSESYSEWPGVMWSFRQDFFIFPMNWSGTVSYVEVSFGQYWLQFWGTGITSWTGYTLMLIFVLQVSTIVSGFLAIFKNNPTSVILSLVFNLLIVILASLVYWSMEENFWREKELLFGFWLSLTSTIMFFIAVVVYYCTRVLQKRGVWSGEVSNEVQL